MAERQPHTHTCPVCGADCWCPALQADVPCEHECPPRDDEDLHYWYPVDPQPKDPPEEH